MRKLFQSRIRLYKAIRRLRTISLEARSLKVISGHRGAFKVTGRPRERCPKDIQLNFEIV